MSCLKWGRRGYDVAELEKVYTANHHRAKLILESVYRYVTDIRDVVGLGFCVSVEHAKFMGNYFNQKGIEALSLHKDSTKEERHIAKSQLVNGVIKFIFVGQAHKEYNFEEKYRALIGRSKHSVRYYFIGKVKVQLLAKVLQGYVIESMKNAVAKRFYLLEKVRIEMD